MFIQDNPNQRLYTGKGLSQDNQNQRFIQDNQNQRFIQERFIQDNQNQKVYTGITKIKGLYRITKIKRFIQDNQNQNVYTG